MPASDDPTQAIRRDGLHASQHCHEPLKRFDVTLEATGASYESFTSLGIQRIAAAAGMARTTFYSHFRDKPSLLIRLTPSATTRLFAVASASGSRAIRRPG